MSSPAPTGTAIEAWKQAVDLQKHFNDILFRIRGLAFAFGGAAVAFAMTRPEAPGVLSSWRGLGLATPWLALYLMDRAYYHELLRAAVRFAESFEERGEAPALCTAITAGNHKTGSGRLKITLFYWLPLAGVSFAATSRWTAWLLSMVPFLAVEALARRRHA